jgi:hypothetical protein
VALTLQLGDHEPVVDAKLGSRVWAVERVRENRTVARDRVMTWVRNRLVDALVHHRLTPGDAAPTDEALARVFAEERMDNRLHKRVIPIFNVTAPFAVTFTEDELAPVEEGFVPDLLALVSEHGGTVVFARPPMSPRLPRGYGDIVPAALEDTVHAAFSARGHHYLDLRALPMAASHFQNLDHLNDEGARRFTWMLVDAMREVGADRRPPVPGVDLLRTVVLEDGVLRPRAPEVRFEGELPAVPGGMQEIRDGRGRSAWFSARAFPWLADVNTLDHSPHGARCSPLRVVEGPPPEAPDRAPRLLGPANVTCEEVYRLGQGRTCHTQDRVYFTASDGTDPWDNGRRYRLALDPERSCPESRWSYPRDRFTVRAPDDSGPFDFLVLQAADLGSTGRGGDPVVVVEVAADRVVVARAVLPLDAVAAGARLAFPATGGRSLEVRVTNPSDHFLLWQHLRVRSRT